jgi:hypothetical protein
MNKKELYDQIVYLARVFDKPIDKDFAVLYVDHLHEYSEREIKTAINKIITTKKFFPKVAEIIELINPQIDDSDLAQINANKIIEVVLELGRYSADKINERLTPVQRSALIAIGGINAITDIDMSQLGNTRAQLRNACKGAIVNEKIETAKLTAIENRGKKVLDFDKFLPEESNASNKFND